MLNLNSYTNPCWKVMKVLICWGESHIVIYIYIYIIPETLYYRNGEAYYCFATLSNMFGFLAVYWGSGLHQVYLWQYNVHQYSERFEKWCGRMCQIVSCRTLWIMMTMDHDGWRSSESFFFDPSGTRNFWQRSTDPERFRWIMWV